MGWCLPTQSTLCTPHLYHLLYHGCQLIGSCVSSSNGGHLRPGTRVSIYFLMQRQMAAKAEEPVMTRTNLTTGALYGPMQSRCAMRWGRIWQTHGEGGQSRSGVGRQQLLLVDVCFGLLMDMHT